MTEKSLDSERPLVSLVVTPRERFSVAERSLESLVAHSEGPYEIVYVDGRSPRPVRRALERRARDHGFELVRTERYLPPNVARNLGLARARGKYVVFVDNDVIVAPGWLSRLVDCAEATGATVVSPLICGGTPLHTSIHCAGGTCGIAERVEGGRPQRYLAEQIARQGERVEEVRAELARSETGLAEFHCMLVRKEYLDRHGPLDEKLLSTREHVDFCIGVARNGGSVWLEPGSVVTYLFDAPLRRSDLPYYMVRWGDRWERESLEHLRRKYDLGVDAEMRRRLRTLGRRRQAFVVTPLVRSITRGRGDSRLEKALDRGLRRVEHGLNRLVCAWHGRGYLHGGGA